jgi:hypothetical protein
VGVRNAEKGTMEAGLDVPEDSRRVESTRTYARSEKS